MAQASPPARQRSEGGRAREVPRQFLQQFRVRNADEGNGAGKPARGGLATA